MGKGNRQSFLRCRLTASEAKPSRGQQTNSPGSCKTNTEEAIPIKDIER